MEKMKLKYLEKMAELYPTMAEASTEIINYNQFKFTQGNEHLLQICMENMKRFLMC